MDFRDAYELVKGCRPVPRSSIQDRRQKVTPVHHFQEPNPPKDLWKAKALALVEWAERQLWSGYGKEALDWLVTQRGLTPETIRAFHLGWIPRDMYRERADWGLEEQLDKNTGRPKQLWLPRGLTIPLLACGIVHRVKIRRPDPQSTIRYYWLPGSNNRTFAIPGPKQFAVVVESELDGVLLAQQAGDLASVFALGTVAARPDKRTAELLGACSRILVALDADDAGGQVMWGTSKWWQQNFPKSKRLIPIGGKDPGEMLNAGIDLRTWIKAGLPDSFESPNPAVKKCTAPSEAAVSPPTQGADDIRCRDSDHWENLAASDLTDLGADNPDDAIFLFALRTVRDADGAALPVLWERHRKYWLRQMPPEAFKIVSTEYHRRIAKSNGDRDSDFDSAPHKVGRQISMPESPST